jgi:two-component system chemotaxis sensor kinase CheA
MIDGLQERIEQIARMAVLSDAGDLPGLVAMQEQAASLAADLAEDPSDGSAEAVAELARKVGALAESIVMREASNVDEAFSQIGVAIEQLQTAASGGPANASASSPSADALDSDDEIVSTWIDSCEGMLSDLEGRLLSLEKSEDASEDVAAIRRTLHTLKGECGVLSLHVPQRLCHEAESLIDMRLEAQQPLPIDPLLALLDWMKSFTTQLSADRNCKPADEKAIMDALIAAQGGASATAAEATATPASAPVASEPAPSATPAPAPSPAEGEDDLTPLAFGPQPGTEENLADFLCEAQDHIAHSEEALLALDQDRGDLELINTVFRAFHTIKGVSGFMGLKPIVSLAHSAEQLLDGARSGTLTLGQHELDLVLASCDMMTKLLDVLEGSTGPTAGDFRALVRRLDAAAQPGGGSAAPEPRQAKASPAATVATASPSASSDEPSPEGLEPSVPAGEPASAGGQAGVAKPRKADQTVKVNTTRMDNLVTMVGELVIAQQMVVQDISGIIEVAGDAQRVQRTLGHMGKMIRDLQEVSMSLRMVNLKSTFQKMTRLVRDVSQKAGKQIEVVTEGEDVELDRNVVEAITDPLVHMIRNSCDHGVEGVEERKAAGKSPVGQVTMRAYHSGGSIVIEIADDGRGLRREKLLAKAKAKGLIPADFDEDSMPDSEVFALIFRPGFSTAEKVTDISGRGVGMDVVRRNIEALRGKIEIRSTPGEGSTFLMQLPLTMAIIDGMVVRVGQQRYVLPTLSIQQSFRPQPEDLKSVLNVGEMVRVRESMLPIYRLSRVLDLREGAQKIEDALLIVMEAHGTRFCVMVDEIIGQQQVVIKTLTQTGQKVRGVSGGAILGDGRVALILDVAQVAEIARDSTESAGLPTNPTETPCTAA